MWYFIVRQARLSNEQFQALQKQATLTETEVFNEPHENLHIFTAPAYRDFVDALDREGLDYVVETYRPTREQLLNDV